MSSTTHRASTTPPELALLIARQSELAALEKKLATVDAAISRQNEKRDQIRAAAPSVASIERQIEEALAAEAAGFITAAERERKEDALRGQLQKLRNAVDQSAAQAGRVQATLTGLEAQRQELRRAVTKAYRECHHALATFIMSEAELAGREYLDAAKSVFEKHQRLMGLASTFARATGTRGRITGNDAEQLFLPAFRVGGHDEHAKGRSKGQLFFEGSFSLGAMTDEASRREQRRIEALGVALEWNGGRFYDRFSSDGDADDASQE